MAAEEKRVASCKVKFESGAYWYKGNANINDIVKVEGAKKGKFGRVIEISTTTENGGLYNVVENFGPIDEFEALAFESLWKSYKPVERKERLKAWGIDENITKKKFLSIVEFRWIEYVINKEHNWARFVRDFIIA